MVRAPYFDKHGMKKGEWSEDEDNKLRTFIQRYGHSNWRQLPRLAGLSRCGKSCRLRWMNYLRPGLKHGKFTKEEEDMIDVLHKKHGNKWSMMAAQLPGRSDNEIKNYWHTRIKNRAAGKDQKTHVLMNEERPATYNNNPKECLIESWSLAENQQEEVETLLAVLSSSTTESSSSCSLSVSVSDYEVTPPELEFYKPAEENINPFLLDDIINGVVVSSSYNMMMFSPFGLAEDLITTQAQASFEDYDNYINDHDGLILW